MNESTKTIEALAASVVTGHGQTDWIHIGLKASSPFPAKGYPAVCSIQTERGLGLAWLQENYPGLKGNITVIDAETGKETHV